VCGAEGEPESNTTTFAANTPLENAAAGDQTHPHLESLSREPGSSVVSFGPSSGPVVDQFAVTRDAESATRTAGLNGSSRSGEFVPTEIAGYEILDEVGRGGMGVVYRARQTRLNRVVALKMILSGAHAGTAERERFAREAQAVAALQNPHIVQIFEVGEANGHPYLVLEFVDGGSLSQHLAGRPWSPRESAELVELLARAIHYAHTQGVVHRDLKPGNILLVSTKPGLRTAVAKPEGDTNSSPSHTSRVALPKITDFGLAKRIDSAPVEDGATKTGAVMGTPSYIAPEQASGKSRDVGPAADVYALGAILYECLTGRPPFRGETALDTVLQVLPRTFGDT
jgi:serine/threonine protein kinase